MKTDCKLVNGYETPISTAVVKEEIKQEMCIRNGTGDGKCREIAGKLSNSSPVLIEASAKRYKENLKVKTLITTSLTQNIQSIISEEEDVYKVYQLLIQKFQKDPNQRMPAAQKQRALLAWLQMRPGHWMNVLQ